jgi:hypothetical protein
MRSDRTVAEARLKSMHSEVLRGLAMAALRRAEEVREENRATRAEIRQRRLAEAQLGMRFRSEPPQSAAPR